MSRKVLGIALSLLLLMTILLPVGAETNRNIKENPDNLLKETIVDLGGRTIKLASAWVDTYDYWEEREETPTNVLKNIQILKDIEQDYNCKIELVDLEGIEWWTQELSEQFALAKSSGDVFADILDWQSNLNPGVVMYRDYLVGIQDIPFLNESLEAGAWSPASLTTEYRGKTYGLNNEVPLGYIRSLLVFNKDYAERFGVGNLFEYVENDEWTFDKFMEVCEKVYDQSGGEVSAVVDRYGMPGSLIDQFMASNGAVPIGQSEGKLITNIGTEKAIRGAQFVLDMINKKLIDMEYIANPGDPYDYFIAGKSMFYTAEGWEMGAIAEELPADVGILPLPKGPDADSYASVIDVLRMYSIVDNGVDGGEGAARVLLAFIKRQSDVYLDIEDEEEPETWLEDLAYDVPDEESLQNAELINQNLVMNYTTMLADVPGWGDAMNQIANGIATPAEAMAAIQAQIQSVIDEANK